MEPTNAHVIFYYPFSYRRYHFGQFKKILKDNHFFHFRVDENRFHNDLYGPDVEMSHHLLTQFYYPFIEEKLLNPSTSLVHFNRYSKIVSLPGTMETSFEKVSFIIHSIDVNLCPFGIGIIATRIQLHDVENITTALSSMHYFRVLQPKIDEELGATFTVENIEYEDSQQLLFAKLVPFLPSFFVNYSASGKNFEKIPFFEDERMYVSAFLQLDEQVEMDDELLYRAGQLNGRDENGDPYISSSNIKYIENFVREHCYDRWAPKFYMLTTTQGHIHLTNYKDDQISKY